MKYLVEIHGEWREWREDGSLGVRQPNLYDVVGAVMNGTKLPEFEYHQDHTDCIWYGSDSGCPVTCSQYRDGWNDAMEYIFKGGKGYQPYRRGK